MRALAREAAPDVLADELDGRRLLPLLGGRLLEACPDELPAAFAARVRTAQAHARARALALEADLRAALDALAAAGIRAVALKGPTLAEELHGDPGLRVSGDLDVLVARDDLAPAARVLREAGYGEPSDPLGPDGLPHLHLELRHDRRATVELHWRVHWYEEAFSAALLERAVPGPGGVLVPEPRDGAAALLLFHARDGFHGLRIPADVGAWWDRYGADGAHGLLDEHAARHPALASSLRAAAAALEQTAGVPGAAWLSASGLRRREALAVRLGTWSGRGDRDQLAANVALVDALLAPPADLGGWWRRARDAAPGGRAAVHLAKTLRRQAAALVRARTSPWDPPPRLVDR